MLKFVTATIAIATLMMSSPVHAGVLDRLMAGCEGRAELAVPSQTDLKDAFAVYSSRGAEFIEPQALANRDLTKLKMGEEIELAITSDFDGTRQAKVHFLGRFFESYPPADHLLFLEPVSGDLLRVDVEAAAGTYVKGPVYPSRIQAQCGGTCGANTLSNIFYIGRLSIRPENMSMVEAAMRAADIEFSEVSQRLAEYTERLYVGERSTKEFFEVRKTIMTELANDQNLAGMQLEGIYNKAPDLMNKLGDQGAIAYMVYRKSGWDHPHAVVALGPLVEGNPRYMVVLNSHHNHPSIVDMKEVQLYDSLLFELPGS